MNTSIDPDPKSSADIGLTASPASRDIQAGTAPPAPTPAPTPDRPVEFSEPQQQVIEWLNQKDATVSDAVEFAGVSRTTFYNWVDTDPNFRAIYMTWLRQQGRVGDAQIYASEVAAVETICDAVRDRRDLSAAKFIVNQAFARRQWQHRVHEQRERAQERAHERALRRADRAQEQTLRREERARERAQRREERARELAQRREDRARELKQKRDDRRAGLEGLL
jgi:hypothetical protein